VDLNGGAGLAIGNNVAHAHLMATKTHSEYVIITAFHHYLV